MKWNKKCSPASRSTADDAYCCVRKASTTCSSHHPTVFILFKCIGLVVTVSFAAPTQLARTDSHVTLNGRLTVSSLTKPFDQFCEDTGVTFHETPLSCASSHFLKDWFFSRNLHTCRFCRYATLAAPALVKLISLVTSLWRGAPCAWFPLERTLDGWASGVADYSGKWRVWICV